MRPALGSVAIQAAGSAATVGAALLVASTLGLAAQGQFGLLRSWGDALVTLAVLGLPQGLLHLQYREAVPVTALRAWVMRYVLALAAACALLAAGLLLWGPHGALLGALPPATFAVLVATVPPAAAHLLWRSLALRGSGALVYAAITALPALLICAFLVPVCLAGQPAGLVWTLFASAAVSALVSGALVARATRGSAGPGTLPPRSRARLWSVGVETAAQSVLTAASPALLLSTVGWLGAPLAEVGAVSLGMHAYQLFGVAAAYVAPMVYDRAAGAGRPVRIDELMGWLRARITLVHGLLAVALALAALMMLRWLWPAGANSLALLWMMALAGVLSMGVRVLVTLMLARGAFRALSVQALVRVLVATGATVLLMQRVPATVAVPLALVGTEALMALWLLRTLRHGDARAAGEPAA